MSSELKSETARINGAKSHGPITPEGKARSSANSRRHGLTASALIDGESDEHFQLLLADFMDHFQPQTAVETDLVEVMAISRWRLRRLLGIETHLFELQLSSRRKQIDAEFTNIDLDGRLAFVFERMSNTGNSLTLMLRYESSLNRSYEKALKQLLHLQSNRPPRAPLGSFRISEPAPVTAPTAPEDLPTPSEATRPCGAAPCAATDSKETQPQGANSTVDTVESVAAARLDPTTAPFSRSQQPFGSDRSPRALDGRQ
jgi:hypothetical protein